jgi:choice-of-anchor A domain-containing protein
VNAPTMAPVNAPTKAPVNAPTKTPIQPPTKAPVKPPTNAPIIAPVRPPIRAPVAAPVSVPVVTPVTAPVAAPVTAPVRAPMMAPTMPTATCSMQPLGAATLYSLFISGDVVGFSHSDGSVAIGGNANFTSAGVSINGNLIVNGNLFAVSGEVGGKLTIGGSNNAGPSFGALGGIVTGKPIDFIKEKARFQLLSQTYATYAVTGITTYTNGEIMLTCGKSGLTVFTVDATKLSTATAFKITVPYGSTVLINVVGSARISMQNFVITVNNTPRNNVLWNFPSAHTLFLRNINIQGSILAPNAEINYSSGNFEGTIVGNSWIGNGKGHDCAFAGCLPIVH